MKKSLFTIGEKADSSHGKKKIHHVSECIKHIEEKQRLARDIVDLFASPTITLRIRLRDECERVILSSSSYQTQGVEDVLWRKVYYEPFATAKRMRKGNNWYAEESGLIAMHLSDGLCYYHYLLNAVLSSNLFSCQNADLLSSFNTDKAFIGDTSKKSENSTDFAFRILTCLGDLSRYALELPDFMIAADPHPLSVRYYLQALHYNKDGGLAHSNLAAVYAQRNQHLLAVVHYLRALTCKKPFVGAEAKLKGLIKIYKKEEANSLQGKDIEFLIKCFKIVLSSITKISHEEVAVHCQDVLVQLGQLLREKDEETGLDNTDGLESSLINRMQSKPEINGVKALSFTLTPDTMVIICSLFILAAAYMNKENCQHSSTAEVLLVCILLTLVSHVSGRLEQRISLVDPSFLNRFAVQQIYNVNSDDANKGDGGNSMVLNIKERKDHQKKTKAKLSRLRRKKNVLNSSSELELSDDSDSNLSDDVNDTASMGSVRSTDEDMDLSHLYSSEDDLSDDDVKVESDQEWDGLTPLEHLSLVSREMMLSPIYVILRWLNQRKDLLKQCTESGDSFWLALSKLLNLISVQVQEGHGCSDVLSHHYVEDMVKLYKQNDSGLGINEEEALLPEDIMLYTVLPFSGVDYECTVVSGNSNDIVLLRILRIIYYGLCLSKNEDCPMLFKDGNFVLKKDATNKKSHMATDYPDSTSKEVDIKEESRKRMAGMQALTAQWLQHEVKSLEERTSRQATMGVYLIPDTSLLINYLGFMKQLLAKPTHMIIIPQIVIASLDHQKRDSVGARDAIRWLEVKLRQGSRFIRAQRPHERSHLNLIKYPKKKDKEAWEWFQMVECCQYLGAQIQYHDGTKPKATAVTLLTGESTERLSSFSFSPSGIVQAAGAGLEHVEEFLSKWQTSTKGLS